MARTIDSDISTHLAQDAIYFTDLVEWTLPDRTIRLSQYDYQTKVKETGVDYVKAGIRGPAQPKTVWQWSGAWLNYIISIGSLSWAVGPESASTTITCANPKVTDQFHNTYHYFTRVAQNNVIEHSTIAIHRVFPDTDGGTKTQENYWFGHVTGYTLSQSELKLEVQYGFAELNRRAFRRFSSTCSNCFADGINCPYNPLGGTGLPQAFRSSRAGDGTVTSVSGYTVTVTGAAFRSNPRPIQKGHIFFCQDTKACGTVTAVATDGNSITVDGWGGGTAPDGGDNWICGPAFKRCDFSKDACAERGMFSVNNTQTSTHLNTDTRRYISTHLIPTNQAYFGKQPAQNSYSSKWERYRRTPEQQDGLDGTVIPVAVGECQFNCGLLLGTADEADGQTSLKFFNGLYVISEGRVNRVVVNHVGGVPIDIDNDARANEYQRSYLAWGTDETTSTEQTDGTITDEQVYMAIGQRSSYAFKTSGDGAQGNNETGSVVDQYENNPYMFNGANGDGVSLSGFAAVRLRADLTDVQMEGSDLEVLVRGVYCRKIDGTGWKYLVNPVEFAYEFMRNSRWGMGLSEGQVDTTQLETESDYCDELIGDSQSNYSGTMQFIILDDPADIEKYSDLDPHYNLTIDIDPNEMSAFIGATIRIQKPDGTVHVAKITGADSSPKSPSNPPSGGDYSDPLPVLAGGIVLTFSPSIPSTVDPPYADGDAVTITIGDGAGRTKRRYKANGLIGEDVSTAEALQAILDNCDGTYYMYGNQLKVVIPKKLTPAQKSALDSELLITDKGLNPTVLFRGGVSTVEWHPYMTDQTFNNLAVTMTDRDNDWENVTINVPNTDAINKMSQIYGNNKEAVLTKNLNLGLTNDRDQMNRIASRKMRRKGMMFNEWRNGDITFELPVHEAMKLEPVSDVRRIDSDILPKWFKYCRIMAIEESDDRLTCKIRAIPYTDGQYDDTGDLDFGKVYIPEFVNRPIKQRPKRIYIRERSDVGYYGDDGVRKERVKLVIAIPYRPTTRRT